MSTTRHSHRGLARMALCALVLGACTPSIAPGTTLTTDPFPGTPPRPADISTPSSPQIDVDNESPTSTALTGPRPTSGRGVIRVLLAPDAVLPAELTADFHHATGYTLEVMNTSPAEQDSSSDLVVGFDGGEILRMGQNLADEAPEGFHVPENSRIAHIPAALPYATDDACVLADTQWYEANRLTPPASVSELSTPDNAARLIVPDPQTSPTGASFAHLMASIHGAQAPTWVAGMKAGGMTVLSSDKAEAAWTINGGHHPLVVGPLSLAARTLSNTSTESYLVPVGGSCVSRTLYAAQQANATNPEGAHSFMAYLYTRPAQALLATHGAAYPLDTTQAEHTVISMYAAPREEVTILPVEQRQRLPQGW